MSETSTSESLIRRVRRVRRVSGARLPFVPYGLVPLAGLALLFLFALWPFAKGVVEGAAERAAAEGLASIGADWASARVDGQQVVLEGAPPSREAARLALEAVRDAKVPTPFGRASPVTRVTGDFVWSRVSGLSDDGGINWTFRLADGVLTLDGDMPSSEIRDQILLAARAEISPPRLISVQDSLTITNETVPEGWVTVALRGVDTVTRCDRGVADFSARRFTLNCELPGADAATVREIAIAPIPLGQVGAVEILAHEAVESCETSLADLLGEARVEFTSSSAVIGSGSAELLDQVAIAVRGCPGTLRIEGHTDSTGLDDTNQQLSQARAEAVRNALIARGLPANRLVATGFGATRPIASNQTAEGRARNRRIEIRVIRASE